MRAVVPQLVWILAVLHLAPRWGAAVSPEARGHNCILRDNFGSPFVLAYFDQEAIPAGCESKDVNKHKQQEVHVISLLAPRDKNPIVSLKLKASGRISPGGVVLVLNSSAPVTWHITTDGINKSTQFRFEMTSESRLSKDTKNGNIRFRVKKDIPKTAELQHLENLERWVRRKFHALTTFARVQEANVISLTLGTDARDSEKCNNSQSAVVGSVLARYRKREQIQGCAVRQNMGIADTDIHIIEVHQASRFTTNNPQDVLIELKSRHNIDKKHIKLILKSTVKVQWKLYATNVGGSLDVITEEFADISNVGPKVVEVQSVKEALNRYTGDSLLEWVDEMYGPPVSFTKVTQANKFDLYVDGTSRRPRRIQGKNQNKGKPTNVPFVQRTPEDQFKHAVSSVCRKREIHISVQKELLRNIGIEKSQLSLQLDQEGCRFQDNGTHYWVKAPVNGCGTTNRDTPFGHLYSNKVIAHGIVEDFEGSAFEDDDLASGALADDTHVDDEDYNTDPFSADVSCEYEFKTPRIPDVRFSLQVYTDGHYEDKVNSFPLQWKDRDYIYVRAKVHGDPNLGAVLWDCNVIRRDPFRLPVNSQGIVKGPDDKYKLIQKMCTIRDDLMIEDTKLEELGFKYILHEYGNMSFIQCNVAACTTDPKMYNTFIPCKPRKELCVMYSIETFTHTGEPETPKVMMTLSQGPFIPLPQSEITTRTPVPSSTPGPGYSRPITETRQCPPRDRVRIQGLETGSVVGIAFAAFFIGVGLTAAIWCIHTHTVPKQAGRTRSTETSGESTPSSTAPITIHQVHPPSRI